ncbi:MAG: Mur ligase family protein [Flavobacteriales bacterium]|nr:Mur ligase family protein [Flavobacteriales bacterium]
MQVHFIAIGGAAMHNLALALREKGDVVTGSDDAIFDPSRSRLEEAGILPLEMGWFPDKIHSKLDAVILGMHAREDNPELLKAQDLGLNIFSYPEYLYEQSKNKKRVVIGGSHGKTTITSMVLHVLHVQKIDCDYMVGAQLDGFKTMVKLSDAPVIVLEGDEYLSSPIDRRPKFHLYRPHIALLSGIAWDHINVFPTFENYLKQFELFIDQIQDGGYLTYCSEDESLNIISSSNPEIETEAYQLPEYEIENGKTSISHEHGETELEIFGAHNLLNMMGALNVCKQLGVTESDFFNAMKSFKGASRRLENIFEREGLLVYKDFAHSPSKVRATVKAVREQYIGHKVIAGLELHTFSSLNKSFLAEYKNTMSGVDIAYVYFDPEAIAHKKLEDLSEELVHESFDRKDLEVFTDSAEYCDAIRKEINAKTIVLLMSSGNFGGIVLEDFAMSL